MIISASRRTDIPGFYFEWFLNRLKAGEVLVRNPVNYRQVSRIPLSPGTVDGIVFWTKNPAPMLPRLEELAPYPYYVQFTINPYGRDLEGRLPDKPELLATFRRLAEKIGPEQVLWRYSPVLVNARYTENFHLESFARLAEKLRGFTRQCKLSFLDIYPKIRKTMAASGISELPGADKLRLAREFLNLASGEGIRLSACGDPELNAAGIPPASCIDGRLIQRIREGSPGLAQVPARDLRKDPGQRPECSCTRSLDIGSYDTCLHGCCYCYANRSFAAAKARHDAHDPGSPLLCGRLEAQDKIVQSKSLSHKRQAEDQLPLF